MNWAQVCYPIALAFLALVQFWIYRKTKQIDGTTKHTDEKINQVHTLINGEKGVVLNALAASLETNAVLSGLPEAKEAAKIARQVADDHGKLAEENKVKT